jgi:quinol monooxygenase YgiN
VLIIAGKVYVANEFRDQWIRDHTDAMKRARAMPGCVQLYVSADPIEEGCVNIFEQWESEGELEAWRAVANPPPTPGLLRGTVEKHLISWSGAPF